MSIFSWKKRPTLHPSEVHEAAPQAPPCIFCGCEHFATYVWTDGMQTSVCYHDLVFIQSMLIVVDSMTIQTSN